MEHPIWVTVIVNRLLGKPALALLAALHIQPSSTEYPIPNHVSMEILVFLVSAIFFLWLRSRISADRPGGTQQCMEMLLTNGMGVGVNDLLEESVGHGWEKYVPMIGSIGIFVLICNLISLVPTLESPTAQVSVPLGCAVVVFVYYNWCGIVKHGLLGHGKHFLGPDLGMHWIVQVLFSILMGAIESVSHLARLLSLTVRLWVNMLVSEMLYGMFLGLLLALYLYLAKINVALQAFFVLPLLLPILFMVLHVFVAVLQAFVFTILPIIYVSGAVAEEH
ncbi:MAG TPA: FoF1 ATP synthase subunit a [Candidatus Limnocylindrales bacterium]|nr:FoF1 ATP synthase subunit a [Candidatus Limnocylindrales bacterium]